MAELNGYEITKLEYSWVSISSDTLCDENAENHTYSLDVQGINYEYENDDGEELCDIVYRFEMALKKHGYAINWFPCNELFDVEFIGGGTNE